MNNRKYSLLSQPACHLASVRYIRHMRNATSSPRLQPKSHRVLVVGGLARLEQQYRCCAVEGVTVEVANTNSNRLASSVVHANTVLPLCQMFPIQPYRACNAMLGDREHR